MVRSDDVGLQMAQDLGDVESVRRVNDRGEKPMKFSVIGLLALTVIGTGAAFGDDTATVGVLCKGTGLASALDTKVRLLPATGAQEDLGISVGNYRFYVHYAQKWDRISISRIDLIDGSEFGATGSGQQSVTLWVNDESRERLSIICRLVQASPNK